LRRLSWRMKKTLRCLRNDAKAEEVISSCVDIKKMSTDERR
jgi:hypothetical protein